VGLLDALDQPDAVEQGVELLVAVAAQRQHVVEGAADRGQLLHLGQPLQRAHHAGRQPGRDAQAAVGAHRRLLAQRTQPHAVARDHALALQPRDARHHRRACHLQLPRQLRRRCAGVGLQQREQVAVGVVETEIHVSDPLRCAPLAMHGIGATECQGSVSGARAEGTGQGTPSA